MVLDTLFAMDVTAERTHATAPLTEAITAVGEREVGEEEVRAFLGDPASVGIVGSADGAAAGYLLGYLVRRIDGARMLIVYDVSVAAESRRRGVGRAMIDEALALARQEGASKTWVITEADNDAATALYRATGAQHSDTDDVVMWWEL